MNYDCFEEKLREIYAVHGKKYPEGPTANAVWERVKNLPDEFMGYCLERFRDEERLPGNMGLVFQRLWPEYLDKTPGLRSPRRDEGCDNCRNGGAVPGLFFIHDPRGGHRYCVKCVCNTLSSLSHMPGWTRERAIERGYLPHDPNAPPEERLPHVPRLPLFH
jgi:hypothetical protein